MPSTTIAFGTMRVRPATIRVSTPLRGVPRTFLTITFPLILPGIIAAFLLSLSLSIDDYIITSFVAGDVSTLPRTIFDSSKVQILPQVHVLATMIMIVAVLVIVLGTVAGNRRRAKG